MKQIKDKNLAEINELDTSAKPLAKPTLEQRKKAAAKARRNNTAFSNRRRELKVGSIDDAMLLLNSKFKIGLERRLKKLADEAGMSTT